MREVRNCIQSGINWVDPKASSASTLRLLFQKMGEYMPSWDVSPRLQKKGAAPIIKSIYGGVLLFLSLVPSADCLINVFGLVERSPFHSTVETLSRVWRERKEQSEEYGVSGADITSNTLTMLGKCKDPWYAEMVGKLIADNKGEGGMADLQILQDLLLVSELTWQKVGPGAFKLFHNLFLHSFSFGLVI